MKSLFLALLLVTSSSFAMGGKGKEWKKELNLTAEQEAKFRELKEGRGEMRELKQKFKESKKAFRAAMKDPKTTNDDLKVKFDEFLKLREEFHRKRFERMLEKRAILTPEQMAKFMERWEKRKGKKRS